MASITSRIAGWTAGRLKGEKARKRTMDWMQKTGVGQLLGVAGDAALIGGALKGAGAIKGGLKELLGAREAVQGSSALSQYANLPTSLPSAGAGAAAPAFAPSAAGQAASSQIAGMAGPSVAKVGGLERFASLPTGMSAAAPVATAPVVPPPTETPGRLSKMLRGGVERAGKAATATGRFARENIEPLAYGASALTDYFANRRRTDLEEEQLRLEQERRNRLAELLMPMFQAEVQRYGQSNRG